MPEVALADIEVGAVLSSDVRDRNGRLVLNAGVALGEKHVRALRMWGIHRVCVEGDAEEATDARAVTDPSIADAAKAELMARFRLNAARTDHPVIEALVAHAYARLVRAGGALGTGEAEDAPPVPLGPPGATPLRGKPTLESLTRCAQTIASPPAVYTRLAQVINQPFSSADDIGQVISGDPALTARLLRIANSALYAFPRQIETVTRAVTIIGTAQLSDLALSMSVTKLFNQIPAELVDVTSFWKHSISCAVLSRGLALLLREHNVERLFIAGLLHDVGRAVMLVHCPSDAREALARAQRNVQPLHQAERAVLGFDHADLGQSLLQNWSLPDAHCAIVARHHLPSAETKFPVEAAVVHIADLMANALQLGSSGERLAPPLEPGAWESLGLGAEALSKLIDGAQHQIADMLAILSQE